jgi:hypothetical protein
MVGQPCDVDWQPSAPAQLACIMYVDVCVAYPQGRIDMGTMLAIEW